MLQRDDAELAALAAADLAAATGVPWRARGQPVTRWGGALPQYTVGHLDRVARIRASLATQPGLAVCGAAYDGVGIPACIGTARHAADQILAGLPARRAAAPPGPARRMNAWLRADRAAAQRLRARDLNEMIRYTMWSVFRVTGSGALDAAGSAAGPAGTGWPPRSPSCASRRRARAWSPAAATTCRACAPTRTTCSGGSPRPPTTCRRCTPGSAGPGWAGPASRSGRCMALHRPGGVQQGPHPRVPGRGRAPRLRVRVPVRPVLRVVPAAIRSSAGSCSPSTARWPASTRTCGPTPSPASR